MKKYSFLFLIAFLLTLSIQGQTSLLWKISGNGLKQTSYMFGTLHLICEDEYVLDSAVQKAFSESLKLILEVDMSNPTVMQKAQTATINANFRNIKADLAPTDVQLLDSCLKADLKAGIDQLGILKPWALMMYYSMTTMITCKATKQYESELTKMAKGTNKPIGELESFEFQMAIFDSIPYSRQLQLLMETVKEKEKGKLEFETLVKAYLNQDVDEIHNLMMQEETMREYADLFFYRRNLNWIPIIKSLASESSVFIAFGAGHLAGEGGVIELLKKEGFTVEPIVRE